MMKKLVLALLTMFATAGLTIAAVVTLISADVKEKDGKVTGTIKVKGEDDKEAVEYKIDDTKFSGGKAGKAVEGEALLKMLTNEKSWGKAKMDVTVSDKKLTEAKMTKKGGKTPDKTDKSN